MINSGKTVQHNLKINGCIRFIFLL
jgi:hypothetical protein